MKKPNKIQPGDFVSVITKKGEEQGILLQSHEQGLILIKLSTGYNVGIKKSDIKLGIRRDKYDKT